MPSLCTILHQSIIQKLCLFCNNLLPHSGKGVKYSAHRVCVSACPLTYLKKRLQSTLHVLPAAAAPASSDTNAISYVLLVMWMTSCFHVTGHVVYGKA